MGGNYSQITDKELQNAVNIAEKFINKQIENYFKSNRQINNLTNGVVINLAYTEEIKLIPSSCIKRKLFVRLYNGDWYEVYNPFKNDEIKSNQILKKSLNDIYKYDANCFDNIMFIFSYNYIPLYYILKHILLEKINSENSNHQFRLENNCLIII